MNNRGDRIKLIRADLADGLMENRSNQTTGGVGHQLTVYAV